MELRTPPLCVVAREACMLASHVVVRNGLGLVDETEYPMTLCSASSLLYFPGTTSRY